jgi:hypothetical protein
MRVQLLSYKLVCDICSKEAFVKRVKCMNNNISNGPVPNGWIVKEIDDCGSTGYSRSIDVCPECKRK